MLALKFKKTLTLCFCLLKIKVMVIISLPSVKGFDLLISDCCLIRFLKCLSVYFRFITPSR